MRIKTFTAPTMPEVMEQIRKTLGEDAIIVSTTPLDEGVQVTAARDTPEPPSGASSSTSPDISKLFNTFHHIQRICRHHKPLAAVEEAWLSFLTPYLSAHEHGLVESLKGFIRFEEESIVDLPSRAPLFFVGPAGSGKSLALAKLAALLRATKQRVEIATTDNLKSGGIEQLLAYGRALGVTVQVARKVTDLQRIYQELDADTLLLVDTPGINHYVPEEMYGLKEYLSSFPSSAILVLPVDIQSDAAVILARTYAHYGVTHLLASKLDTARHYGGLLSAAHASRLKLIGYTCSPAVGDGVHALTPSTLGGLLVHTLDATFSQSLEPKLETAHENSARLYG